MLDRPEHLPFFVRNRDEVKLAPDEAPEAAFKLWLAKLVVPPLVCVKHRLTPLVLVKKETKFWQDYEDPRWSREHTPIPGQFVFNAEFRCPSCPAAYALCPPEFHETSFDTFDTSTPERAATLAKAREFAAQVNTHACGFALFVGPPGPGKTRLACNIVRNLENRDSLYVRQGDLTVALRSTYRPREVEHDLYGREVRPQHPLKITQDVHFLVLDEIGCTALANDERLLLDELIKYRYEHRKPMILISNLLLVGKPDAPGLKQFLGDALTDRIKEATGNGKFIVQFNGGSYRRSTGENYLHGFG